MAKSAYVIENGSQGTSSLDFIIAVNGHKIIMSYQSEKNNWLFLFDESDIAPESIMFKYIKQAMVNADINEFVKRHYFEIAEDFENELHKLVHR